MKPNDLNIKIQASLDDIAFNLSSLEKETASGKQEDILKNNNFLNAEEAFFEFINLKIKEIENKAKNIVFQIEKQILVLDEEYYKVKKEAAQLVSKKDYSQARNLFDKLQEKIDKNEKNTSHLILKLDSLLSYAWRAKYQEPVFSLLAISSPLLRKYLAAGIETIKNKASKRIKELSNQKPLQEDIPLASDNEFKNIKKFYLKYIDSKINGLNIFINQIFQEIKNTIEEKQNTLKNILGETKKEKLKIFEKEIDETILKTQDKIKEILAVLCLDEKKDSSIFQTLYKFVSFPLEQIKNKIAQLKIEKPSPKVAAKPLSRTTPQKARLLIPPKPLPKPSDNFFTSKEEEKLRSKAKKEIQKIEILLQDIEKRYQEKPFPIFKDSEYLRARSKYLNYLKFRIERLNFLTKQRTQDLENIILEKDKQYNKIKDQINICIQNKEYRKAKKIFQAFYQELKEIRRLALKRIKNIDYLLLFDWRLKHKSTEIYPFQITSEILRKYIDFSLGLLILRAKNKIYLLEKQKDIPEIIRPEKQLLEDSRFQEIKQTYFRYIDTKIKDLKKTVEKIFSDIENISSRFLEKYEEKDKKGNALILDKRFKEAEKLYAGIKKGIKKEINKIENKSKNIALVLLHDPKKDPQTYETSKKILSFVLLNLSKSCKKKLEKIKFLSGRELPRLYKKVADIPRLKEDIKNYEEKLKQLEKAKITVPKLKGELEKLNQEIKKKKTTLKDLRTLESLKKKVNLDRLRLELERTPGWISQYIIKILRDRALKGQPILEKEPKAPVKYIFYIPGKKIPLPLVSYLELREKIVYLSWFFGRKLPRILFNLFLIIVIAAVLLVIKKDTVKKPTYEDLKKISYSELEWEDKVDNQGYTQAIAQKAKFKWKAEIQAPKTSYIFKVQDIGKLTVHLKDITGIVSIPEDVVFDEMDRYPPVGGYRLVKDKKELTLSGKAHFAAILGLSIVSPMQGATIRINGNELNSVTIQIPKEATVLKAGDGPYPAGTYKINECTYFFHNFVAPAIVYYNPIYHIKIQTLLIIIGMVFFTAFLLLLRRIPLSRFMPKPKHFLVVGLTCAILMLLLATLIPSPYPIILNWDNRANTYQTKGFIVNDRDLMNYLWWVLALNKSIDAMIIGDTTIANCGTSRYRHFYLTKYSVQKFLVLEEYKNTPCAKLIYDIAPQKTITLPEKDVEKELATLKSRDHPLALFFIFNIKTIFFLAAIILAVACAYLVWKTFTIKNIKDAFILILHGIFLFFGITILYIITGLLAHMPIGYHGYTNLGLIMSNYALPGVLRGGNNFRTLFAMLGAFSVIFFVRHVRKKIKLSIYANIIIIIILSLILPKVEYYTKRLILTATSAEAYVWDYKIDLFNSFDFYKSIRDNEFINYIKWVTSDEAKAQQKMLLAKTMVDEARYAKSIDLYKEILAEYKDHDEIVSQAFFELGEAFFEQRISSKYYREFEEEFVIHPRSYYLQGAIEYYTKYLQKNPENYNPRALLRLAKSYEYLKDFTNSIKRYQQYLDKFGDDENIELAVAHNLRLAGRWEESRQKYEELLEKYPLSSSVPSIKANLAFLYYKKEMFGQAYNLYLEILKNYPEELEVINSLIYDLKVFLKTHYEEEENLDKFFEATTSPPERAIEIYKDLDNKFKESLLNQQILIRIAEAYKQWGEDLKEKKKDFSLIEQKWSESEKFYQKVIQEYPQDPAAEYSARSIIKIKVKVNEMRGIAITFDKGEKNYAFDKNNVSDGKKEIFEAGSLRFTISPQKNDCPNNICEIGEIKDSCPQDCSDSSNKLIIAAKSLPAGEELPHLEIWYDLKFIKEFNVPSTDYQDFEIPYYLTNTSSHQIDIVYTNPYQDFDKKEIRAVYIDHIKINDIEIPIEYASKSYVASQLAFKEKLKTKAEEELERAKKEIARGSKIKFIFEVLNPFKEKRVIPTVYPNSMRSLFSGVEHASRGMILFFASLCSLPALILIRKSLRTFVSPFIIFLLSRGIIRVAEQDPIRAWFSIYPGIITGLQIIIALFIINIVIYIITNPIRFQFKIKEAKEILSAKVSILEKIKELIKTTMPKV